jgi:hypothetical protein
VFTNSRLRLAHEHGHCVMPRDGDEARRVATPMDPTDRPDLGGLYPSSSGAIASPRRAR